MSNNQDDSHVEPMGKLMGDFFSQLQELADQKRSDETFHAVAATLTCFREFCHDNNYRFTSALKASKIHWDELHPELVDNTPKATGLN